MVGTEAWPRGPRGTTLPPLGLPPTETSTIITFCRVAVSSATPRTRTLACLYWGVVLGGRIWIWTM